MCSATEEKAMWSKGKHVRRPSCPPKLQMLGVTHLTGSQIITQDKIFFCSGTKFYFIAETIVPQQKNYSPTNLIGLHIWTDLLGRFSPKT